MFHIFGLEKKIQNRLLLQTRKGRTKHSQISGFSHQPRVNNNGERRHIIVGFNYYCEPTFSFLNNLLDTVLLAPIFSWVFNHPWKFTWESTVGLIDKSLLSWFFLIFFIIFSNNKRLFIESYHIVYHYLIIS